ncbi:MAG TPA: PH domain-containing protein [Nocardioidaceae bacterium]|nr:PH domain-containing protein [Nocardioidaceae bacterium]
MPAASDLTPPTLPRTFRPLGVRIAVVVFGAMLLAVCLVAWFALPPHIRAEISWLERATVIVFGIALAAVAAGLARCRIDARQDGVTIVNGYRKRAFAWNQLVAISLRPGGPWAVIDLSDGTAVSAMAIQSSDGPRALAQVRTVRALISQQSRTARDD